MAFHFGATPQLQPIFFTHGEVEASLWQISGAPSMRNVWKKRTPGLPMLINGTGVYEYGALHFSYALETYTVHYGALQFSYILGGIVNADLSETAAASDSLSAAGSMYQALVAASAAATTSTAAAGKLVTGEVEEEAVIQGTTILNQTLHVLASSSMAAVAFVRVQGEETPVWLVNTDLWAATRFTNFSFDSYARIGDRYFAASPDGLFELTGDTDDEEQIDASVMLPRDRSGTSQQKRVDRAYVHGTSDKKLEIRVITPSGDVHAYKSEVELGDEVTVQRVKIGRGLVAQYWQFEARNVAGGDLSIDQIEVVSLHTTRKIRRDR
jgi:hypothetical protein